MTAGVSAELPYRPRLAEHALARRHLIDGEEVVVVHDTRNGDLIRMNPRLWDILAACDGTRELDGIALAAARVGAYRRESEVRAVLEELHRRGLLADGIAPPPAPALPAEQRPLEVLSDFQLACDESGVCCGMYGSVVFTPLEAARARALRPEVLDGGERPERVFLPTAGADRGSLAVALVDGCCPYREDDGRCSLHVAGGEAAKPRGCRSYPASFVDDGEAVRVSVAVECPCVLASAVLWSPSQHVALRAPVQPLVPQAARVAADLGAGARISALPEQVALTGRQGAPRAAYVAWARFVAGHAFPRDAVAGFWSLGAAVGAAGLDETASRRALDAPAPPSLGDLLPWVEALDRRAEARREVAATWRSERDRSRMASAWIAEAVRALRSPAALEAALRAGEPGQGGLPVNLDAEAFYARATLHGHHLAVEEAPLATALRDRAVRLLLGRALGAVLARAAPDDPAHDYPLTLVEALMRAHGLNVYAREVDQPAGPEGK